MSKKRKDKGFPKTLYMTANHEGREAFYIPHQSIDDVEARNDTTVDVPVARYELIEVGRVITTREYIKS